jgi:malate synthase
MSGSDVSVLESVQLRLGNQLIPIDVLGENTVIRERFGQNFFDVCKRVLCREALVFLVRLHREFEGDRRELLAGRRDLQQALDNGYLPEIADVDEAMWRISAIPRELQDRRVEITGPPDRKMVINALNSGAKVFMADFEDSLCPTFQAVIEGQQNVNDAVNKTIFFVDERTKKEYYLRDDSAEICMRFRGWHLDEAHLVIDGQRMSALLFDLGLFLFHNGVTLLNQGKAPHCYAPKLENALEAALLERVITFSEEYLGMEVGTVKVTVLIETILAAFESERIIFELRRHIVALNCGRWDYIFSFIKKFRAHRWSILPDRNKVTMEIPMMRDYSRGTISVCHRRGILAIGGMAAQIPVRGDEQANSEAFRRVQLDKIREVRDGHDGTWVAHPGLIGVATAVFNAEMPGPNQVQTPHAYPDVTRSQLLNVPSGPNYPITEEGIRHNIRVGILYLSAWLNGTGCVPINNLMEDAATAELAKAQLWQWRKFEVEFVRSYSMAEVPMAEVPEKARLTSTCLAAFMSDEFNSLRDEYEASPLFGPQLTSATIMLTNMIWSDEFSEFLTLAAYEDLIGRGY